MELRQPLRDIDVFQRVEGLNARRLLTSRKSFILFGLLMGPALFMAPGLLQTCLLVAGIYFSQVYYHARYGPRVVPQLLVRLDRRINDYTPEYLRLSFAFFSIMLFLLCPFSISVLMTLCVIIEVAFTAKKPF